MQDIQARKKEWNISLQEFESWPGNNLGGFKVYRSMKQRFAKVDGSLDKDKAFDYCAKRATDFILNEYMQFDWMKFSWMKQITKDALKQAVYWFIQGMLNNKEAWFKTNQSSLSTPGYSASVVSKNILLSRDVFATEVKSWLKKSQITKYERVPEDEAKVLFETSPGSFEVIGWTEVFKITKELK